MKRNSLFHLIPQIIAIALPISGGRLLTIFASFIAMMMVAQLGEQSLAAGFLAATSSTAILILTSSIFYALGIRIRYYRGQNKSPESIGLLVKNSFFLAVVLAFPAAMAIAFLDKMLLMIGQEPELVALTKAYFFYAGLGMFPMLVMMVIGQFYVGIGKPYFTLVVGLISLPLTILLSYGLVLGRWGLPLLGLSGVSLASLLVQLFMMCGSLLVIWFTKLHRHYSLFQNPLSFDWQICQSLLDLGFPIGMQLGGELIVMALANYLMGYWGVEAMAALQVTSQYSMIVIMLSFGLAQAMACLVGEAHGKQEVSHCLIKKYVQASLVLLLCYTVPISLIFCTFSTFLAEFYMGTKQLQPGFMVLTHAFFMLGALFLFFDGVRTLLSGILRGLQDAKTATRINLLAMWCISLPISAAVVFIDHGGPISLRIGFLSGFLVAMIVLAMHLSQKLASTGQTSIAVGHIDVSAEKPAMQ